MSLVQVASKEVKSSGFVPTLEDAPAAVEAAVLTLDSAPDHGVVAGPSQLLVAVANPFVPPLRRAAGGLGEQLHLRRPGPVAARPHGDRTADGGAIRDQSDEGIIMTRGSSQVMVIPS